MSSPVAKRPRVVPPPPPNLTTTNLSICQECNLVFLHELALNNHLSTENHKMVLSGMRPPIGTHFCYLCWSGFKSMDDLRIHYNREVHEDNILKYEVKAIWTSGNNVQNIQKSLPKEVKKESLNASPVVSPERFDETNELCTSPICSPDRSLSSISLSDCEESNVGEEPLKEHLKDEPVIDTINEKLKEAFEEVESKNEPHERSVSNCDQQESKKSHSVDKEVSATENTLDSSQKSEVTERKDSLSPNKDITSPGKEKVSPNNKEKTPSVNDHECVRSRSRDSERDRHKSRDRERDKDRDRERDKDRNHERDKERDWDHHRGDRERDRDRDRFRIRDRDYERDQYRRSRDYRVSDRSSRDRFDLRAKLSYRREKFHSNSLRSDSKLENSSKAESKEVCHQKAKMLPNEQLSCSLEQISDCEEQDDKGLNKQDPSLLENISDTEIEGDFKQQNENSEAPKSNPDENANDCDEFVVLDEIGEDPIDENQPNQLENVSSDEDDKKEDLENIDSPENINGQVGTLEYLDSPDEIVHSAEKPAEVEQALESVSSPESEGKNETNEVSDSKIEGKKNEVEDLANGDEKLDEKPHSPFQDLLLRDQELELDFE